MLLYYFRGNIHIEQSIFSRSGFGMNCNNKCSPSSLSGAVRASCTWSSPSPQTAVTCWGRTAPPSLPSQRSSISTPHTSCPSEEPSTCPCCTLSLCRPSDTNAPPSSSSWCYWTQYILYIPFYMSITGGWLMNMRVNRFYPPRISKGWCWSVAECC